MYIKLYILTYINNADVKIIILVKRKIVFFFFKILFSYISIILNIVFIIIRISDL